MHKLFAFYSFIIASLGLIMGFVTATTDTQLITTTALFPICLYFAGQVFPRKKRRFSSASNQIEQLTKLSLVTQPNAPQPLEPEEDIHVADIDKRAFLKLIGAAGLSLFLFSVFTKRGEASFFSNATDLGTTFLKDSSGKKIDPAEKQPTDGYKVAEIDGGPITFYGFIDKESHWYIMREDTQNGSFRYVKGDNEFPKHWANRKKLNYDYYNNVF